MGKPRMIILIRHGQSEGNKNREIHQFIPDHRVKLTPQGQGQAEDAGRRLRSMLKPDDNVIFFTSPYRRTRETTEGILKTLTQDDPQPSPFPRHAIKVYEEPRLREQDFGNFQPCSAEMERMWQERADYGHFFYRIPNGESAADAYDRVSGFNESLWRQFGEADFPSVCVLVTHGLMTRVFLMKWYHWSVEYFEDLRNVNHCEFIVMNQSQNGKYRLDNQLRTWSDLKRRAAELESSGDATSKPRVESVKPTHTNRAASPSLPTRKWGGCPDGCNHAHHNYSRRTKRQNTADLLKDAVPSTLPRNDVYESLVSPMGASESAAVTLNGGSLPRNGTSADASADASNEDSPQLAGLDTDDVFSSEGENGPRQPSNFLKVGRDFGGSHSGAGTPAEGLSDDSDYFNAGSEGVATKLPVRSRSGKTSSAEKKQRQGSVKSPQEWASASGMGSRKRADRLGDDDDDAEEPLDPSSSAPPDPGTADVTKAAPRKGDAMKHAMAIADGDEVPPGGVVEDIVEKMKDRDRKTLREVY